MYIEVQRDLLKIKNKIFIIDSYKLNKIDILNKIIISI